MSKSQNPIISDEMETALRDCFAQALSDKHEMVTIEHLLLHVLDSEKCKNILEAIGADSEKIRENLKEYMTAYISPTLAEGQNAQATPGLQAVIQRAVFIAKSRSEPQVNIDQLLLAIAAERESHAASYLKNAGATNINLVNFITKGLKPGQAPAEATANDADDSESSEKSSNPLEAFAENLNKRAADGKIDALVGREAEVQRAIQILCRRRKSNPLLVGEAGVGKTAIAEGLAYLIQKGEVPPAIANCVIHSLNMGALVAGTKYRGDFEQRINGLLKKVRNDPNIILFIDEIHTMIGAGAASGNNMDASNLLKTALANGEVRTIGATTHTEYRQIIEKEHALARRFQKIDVNEPTVEQTIDILRGLAPKFEEHHGVKYTDEAIVATAKLASQHIHTGHMPDKAIDVFDEAGADQRSRPAGEGKSLIDVAEIEQTVSKIARIPARSVSRDDKARLQTLAPDIKNRVFGQDSAADSLAMAIKRNRATLKVREAPIGKFLFAGPTGVGKTEMARALADILGMPLVRFDMSEYMEAHSVSRLIGAPPGYVGMDQGGQLTEAINKKPHCVLLLDEIEKAHPDVFNVLLQVMDHGKLTDNQGRPANFKNVVLIMTSNVGAQAAQQRAIGFNHSASEVQDSKREEAIKKTFTPEFRNRLDATVTFRSLDDTIIMQVVEKLLKGFQNDLATREKPVTVTYTDEVKAYLRKEGFSPDMGARPMQRLVETSIENLLVDDLLFGELENGGTVEFDMGAPDATGKSVPVRRIVPVLAKTPPKPRARAKAPA